jgi:DNA-binding NarL/FixJ family response regulator
MRVPGDSPMQPIRVLLADDHKMFREALRSLLGKQAGIEIVGEARDGGEVEHLVATTHPDVLLLDVQMPRLSGLEALRRLTENGARVHTILLTGIAGRDEIVEAIRLGAHGIVTKDASIETLVKALRHVMDGYYWIGNEGMSDLLRFIGASPETARRPAETLTRRELQVVSAVLQGATNKDMARQLGLSEQTVKNHLSSIFDKLGVSNRLELALFAVNHRLVCDDPPRQPL